MTVSAIGNRVGGGDDGTSEAHQAPVVATTGIDLIAELILESSLENEKSAREARAALRETASTLNDARIAHMREAADWRLAAGIASGIGTIGASLAKAGGAAASGSSTSDATSDGGWDGVGGAFDGSGKITSAILGWGADSASASAAREEALADDVGAHAAEASSDAEAAEGLRGRMLESLGRTVDETRRAEEAATRA